MNQFKKPALPFIILGIGLMTIGLSGQRTFVFVGLTFLMLGIVFSARSRR